MPNDIAKGSWKQIRGQAKVWWGKLTDNDRVKVDGKVDQLVGRVQEKYGEVKHQAIEENEAGQNDRL